MVLLHGMFGSLNNLASLGRTLETCYTVIRIDLRNHGRSEHCDTMSYTSMAADVIGVLDTEDVSACYLVGHSMGGKVAMEIAMHCPQRVLGAVFMDIAPVTYPQDRHTSIFRAFDAVNLAEVRSRNDADRLMAEYVKEPGTRQFLLTNLYKNGESYQWRLNLDGIRKNYPALAEPGSTGVYNRPCLFVKGELSDYVTEKHREAILSRFPAASVRVLQGAGHWLHAEKPAAFNGLVKRFLDKTNKELL